MRYFTLLDQPTIEALDTERAEHPEKRESQRALAREVTRTVHGDHALAAAQEVSALLFESADPTSLSIDALHALQLEIPVFVVEAKDELTNYDILEAACIGPDALFKSKGDMRRMIQQGGVYLNGKRCSAEREVLSKSNFLAGEFVLIRKGARSYGLVKVK